MTLFTLNMIYEVRIRVREKVHSTANQICQRKLGKELTFPNLLLVRHAHQLLSLMFKKLNNISSQVV